MYSNWSQAIFTSNISTIHSEDGTKPGAARAGLRDGCADEHIRVDTAFSQFDLSTIAGYGAFLQAQSACIGPIEDALTTAGIGVLVADWPDRRRAALLADDLSDLGLAEAPALASPSLSRASEMLGALYVLEGSRFGGAVLGKRVYTGAPLRFLTTAAPPKAWRTLLDTLDRNLIGTTELAIAICAARAVFRCFEVAASQTWERVRV